MKKAKWLRKAVKRKLKENDKGIVDFIWIMRHFFGHLRDWIEEMEDPRHPGYTIYIQSDPVFMGLMKNICSVENMRQMEERFNEETCIDTLRLLSGLKALHDAGSSSYEGEAAKYRNQYEYQELLDICYGKSWVTDIRESFAGAETVMHYLGRYTHRIAVSNSRILRMDENTVTIKVKDYKSGGLWKELTLNGIEFVRRFLMHVPPKGFVRIRHYGILSNQNKRKLIPICRNLIGCREFLRRFKKDDKVQAIRILYKKDVTVCPCCGGVMSYEVCTEWTPKRSSA